MVYQIKDVVCDIHSKRKLASDQHTVKICVENITRVVTKNDEEDLLNYFLEPQTLLLFFLLFFASSKDFPSSHAIWENTSREKQSQSYTHLFLKLYQCPVWCPNSLTFMHENAGITMQYLGHILNFCGVYVKPTKNCNRLFQIQIQDEELEKYAKLLSFKKLYTPICTYDDHENSHR